MTEAQIIADLNKQTETFECKKCEEIVEADENNCIIHKLCWICLEDYM